MTASTKGLELRSLVSDGKLELSLADVELSPPGPGEVIVRIEAAEMDGQKLEPVSIADLDNRNPLWQSDYTDQTQPRYITQLNPNTITLYPKVAGTVTARLVLKPSINAFTLPEFLIEQYGEQIGKGAAAGVLMTPDPKVQNFEVGAMLAMEFQSWLDGLNVKAAKGQQNARLRTKGSYF